MACAMAAGLAQEFPHPGVGAAPPRLAEGTRRKPACAAHDAASLYMLRRVAKADSEGTVASAAFKPRRRALAGGRAPTSCF